MSAPRTINGGPEPRTIHHCIFKNIENSYHLSLNSNILILKQVLCPVVYVSYTVVELGQLA